ncbi:MAG: transglycosylase SLT domain-containing protein, partial [Gammaproteobacteria bacterium]|nr:transglycosylase SLT domain-containing protein [Gammaproteobacteria bacterium]
MLGGCQTLNTDTAENPNEVKVARTENMVPAGATPQLDTVETLTSSTVFPYFPIEHTVIPNDPPDLDSQAVLTHQSLAQLQNTEQKNNAAVVKEIIEEAGIALQNTNNAWSRLQSGMQMTSVMNKRVKVQLDWYLAHRKYLDRVMQRAAPILPFILDVINEKNLPSEMALLPIVESAFQPFAYSHGRASGMWQIIPSTGRYLGLKQNWWYDGR